MQNNPAPEIILDDMHRAIMAADFGRLHALTPDLETALMTVQSLRDKARIQRLKSKAERNEACLLAAARGVRAAGRRFKELRDAASGLVTYDGNGQRADLSGQTSLTRRY